MIKAISKNYIGCRFRPRENAGCQLVNLAAARKRTDNEQSSAPYSNLFQGKSATPSIRREMRDEEEAAHAACEALLPGSAPPSEEWVMRSCPAEWEVYARAAARARVYGLCVLDVSPKTILGYQQGACSVRAPPQWNSWALKTLGTGACNLNLKSYISGPCILDPRPEPSTLEPDHCEACYGLNQKHLIPDHCPLNLNP
jgi:hypothetical protein